MNYNQNIIYVLLLFLVLVLGFYFKHLLNQEYNLNRYLKNEIINLNRKLQTVDEVNDDLINSITINIKQTSKKINYNEILRTDSLFFNNLPKFVFQFNNEESCSPCIDQYMNDLKILANKIGHENIVIFAAVKNERDLFVLKETQKIPFKIIDVNFILGDIREISTPIYYILDRDSKINNLFSPHNGIPSLTEIYFDEVEKKFFDKMP